MIIKKVKYVELNIKMLIAVCNTKILKWFNRMQMFMLYENYQKDVWWKHKEAICQYIQIFYPWYK